MKLIDLLMQELPKRGGWPTASEGLSLPLAGNDLVTSWRFNSDLDRFVTCTYGSEVVTREEYEAAIASSTQPAWSGVGRPPEGIECEVNSGRDSWSLCKVVHSSSAGVGFIYLEEPFIEGSRSKYIGVLDCIPRAAASDGFFRPILTKAERKRHETLYALEKLDIDTDVTIRVLDAIAAGIIPHVTLK